MKKVVIDKRKTKYALEKAYTQYILSCLKSGKGALKFSDWFGQQKEDE